MSNTIAFATAWQRVWRLGIAPQLTTEGLQGLKAALERNEPRLITGATLLPAPLQPELNSPVQGCCPLCYGLLDGLQPGEVSVGLLEQGFAAACRKADELLGEPASVRYFLNAVDEWSRDELRQNLSPEIEWALAQRAEKQPDSPLARLLAESIRRAERSRPA
jgi:hypothetical protein